jgi:hypothetical protein
MLDTDYNDLCFHVSQAFFPRTGAWENLRKALRAEYEESVWDHLNGTESAPFEALESTKVAVKVIDQRGNELMVVKPLARWHCEWVRPCTGRRLPHQPAGLRQPSMVVYCQVWPYQRSKRHTPWIPTRSGCSSGWRTNGRFRNPKHFDASFARPPQRKHHRKPPTRSSTAGRHRSASRKPLRRRGRATRAPNAGRARGAAGSSVV